MEELAKILKAKRTKEGSLDLDVPESKIILDDNGIAIDVKKYETNFAHEIIEQFMLITNETVAERFFWLEAPFIYRVHENPDPDKIDELNKFLFNLGYKIKYKWTWKRIKELLKTLLIVLIIIVVLWFFPPTHNLIIKFYESNTILQVIVDVIGKIFKGTWNAICSIFGSK